MREERPSVVGTCNLRAALESDDVDPSSNLIIREALRRGIEVVVFDPRAQRYRLKYCGRSLMCTESLSERTPMWAVACCDDKAWTARILSEAGLSVPDESVSSGPVANADFLRKHGEIVVKPASGEQGQAVFVGLTSVEEVDHALHEAAKVDATVLLQQCVRGHDVRLIVIGGEVVAAAERRPPQIVGDGSSTVRQLVEALSERRAAETAGHSRVPLDAETTRCVARAGHAMTDVLPVGVRITVRAAANLHTGGTLHDVTERLHPAIREVARRASKALEIPVVGLDLMMPDLEGEAYWILEANERPGFAHHEPQPVAERFVDWMFPESMVNVGAAQ